MQDSNDTTPTADDLCRELDQRVGPRRIYPISFGIPAKLVVDDVPEKTQDFATGTSRGRREYKFDGDQQQAYYDDYRRSYFGLTYRKGGWDCLRHLEVMANGCLPYFPGLGELPRLTMAHYPKIIMAQAQQLLTNTRLDRYEPKRIDPNQPVVQDPGAYRTLAARMLNHVRQHCTTQAMAEYLLRQMGAEHARSVLFISEGKKPDYLCDLLFHGLRSKLGSGCVDIGKPWWMYQSASFEKRSKLYGKGFTYSGHLEEIDIDRSDLPGRVKKREFDLVVFGSVRRWGHLLPMVREYYAREEVALIDGDDFGRQVGTTKGAYPEWGWRKVPRAVAENLAYQGVYFKREMDEALVIGYAARMPG